jgi:excisionase family DNA binding protein
LRVVGTKQVDKPEVEKLINVDAAAELLDCSPSMVKKMVKEDRLPHLMIGNRPKFLPSKLHAWVLDQIEQSVNQRPESAA